MEMRNGESNFKYGILNDFIILDVKIEFDDYGDAKIEETLVDGYDLTEEILSFGLEDKLIEYAEDNPEYFSKD